MKFDHSKESIGEALGLNKKEISNLAGTLSEIVAEVVMSKDSYKTSHIGEKIAEKLSYSELVFVATQHLLEKIHDFEAINKKLLIDKIISMIDDSEEESKE